MASIGAIDVDLNVRMSGGVVRLLDDRAVIEVGTREAMGEDALAQLAKVVPDAKVLALPPGWTLRDERRYVPRPLMPNPSMPTEGISDRMAAVIFGAIPALVIGVGIGILLGALT